MWLWVGASSDTPLSERRKFGCRTLVIFKGADLEFVRSELDTPIFRGKNPSHLHPNRPSDQLSWRTPRHILSMKPGRCGD